MPTIQTQLQSLFVAWQDADSRRYFPVARLLAGVSDGLYEFAYIKGAELAAKVGFVPFPAFRDVHNVYRSEDLFPFFENRLMSAKRPDYASYLQSLALNHNADPMQILGRSGGTRATDFVELFPMPLRTDGNGTYQSFFWLHGFRHLSTAQQDRALSLRSGDELFAIPEPTNEYDPNAIQLQTSNNLPVGYMPRYLTDDTIRLLLAGQTFRVMVERVNPPPAPIQQRMLCRLQAHWPEGFRPFESDVFRPISPLASDLCQFSQ